MINKWICAALAAALLSGAALAEEDEPASVGADGTVAVASKGAALPADGAGAVIYRDHAGRYCIGGVHCAAYCSASDRDCRARFSYVIELDKPAYISAIQLNAHDNIGKSRRSKLVVKINGKTIDSQPVFRLGSSISMKADIVGQVITIESAHQHKGFLRGGEEAMIWDVYVFGGKTN